MLSCILCPAVLRAQCDGDATGDLTWNYKTSADSGFSLGGFFKDLVSPQIALDTKEIRAYVRDPRFHELSKLCGDLRAVDAIYLRALQIADDDIVRALFLSAMAVLEHQKISVSVPVAGKLVLPISLENEEAFAARMKHIPRRIYPDSPLSETGDIDKLQHFFASAYIAYSSGSKSITRFTGNFVEWSEGKMVEGGADDPRDKRANRHGTRFGNDLLTHPSQLPSDYLGRIN